jgi:osmotically-inducible protein OsmY
MNFSKVLGITGFAVLLISPNVATLSYAGQSTAKTIVVIDDSTLKESVKKALDMQPTLKHQNIDVKVTDRVVTLTGAVLTSERKARAGRSAKVAGVTRVVNELMIDPKATDGLDDKIVDATKTAAHETATAAKTVGEKTKDGAVATGEVITDAWINTRIHSKMVDEDTLKGSDVNVDVKDHMVTLKGTVVSAAGKARAEAIAKETDGVKSVSNLLTIGPKM